MAVNIQVAADAIHARILMGSSPRVERALKARHNATPGDKMKKTPIHSTWSQSLAATVGDNFSDGSTGGSHGLAVQSEAYGSQPKRVRAAAFVEAFQDASDNCRADALATAVIAVSRGGSVLQHTHENP